MGGLAVFGVGFIVATPLAALFQANAMNKDLYNLCEHDLISGDMVIPAGTSVTKLMFVAKQQDKK